MVYHYRATIDYELRGAYTTVMSADLAGVPVQIAPWDDKLVIPVGWVRWSDGELSEEARGPCFVVSADSPGVAARVAKLWNDHRSEE